MATQSGPVTHIPFDLVESQVNRLLASALLKNSEPLRALLSYLALNARKQWGQPVREQEIAAAVFHRGALFDSRLDSVVRVHTGRLRSKLAEYYMGQGSADEVILEVPRGLYCLQAHYRDPPKPVSLVDVADSLEPSGIQPQAHSPVHSIGAAVLARLSRNPRLTSSQPGSPLKGLAKFLSGWWRAALPLVLVMALAGVALTRKPSALHTFWSSFGSSGDPALIVFSNPRFIGSSTSGLRLFAPGQPISEPVNDTFTGTGEVAAAFELEHVADLLHRPVRLKRSQLLTWDEARSRDIIFLGAPEHNLPTGELPLFDFSFSHQGPVLSFCNAHPKLGEQRLYTGTGPPYVRDYAIIAETGGFAPGRRMLVLAGTTTYGTQAAAEFICREQSVRQLLNQLGRNSGRFTAIIEVGIADGVVVRHRLLSVHSENMVPP